MRRREFVRSTSTTRTANIVVGNNEHVTCTYTNVKRGKIIVEKQTDPDGSAGSFVFTGDAAGSIGDGQQIVVDGLLPNTYTSTETDPAPPFDLTAISCDDTQQHGQRRESDRHLPPGGRRDGQMRLHQHQAWLDHDHQGRAAQRPQDFGFTTTGTGLSPFSLDDDNDATLPRTTTFTDIKPGSLLGHREPRHRLGADRSDLRRHQRLDRRQERHDRQHRPHGGWLCHLHVRQRQGRPHHRQEGHEPGRATRRPSSSTRTTAPTSP